MLLPTLVLSFEVIGVYVTCLFILSVLIKRNDIADVAWGVGILLVAVIGFAAADTPSTLSEVLLLLAALWGVRLSVRILARNLKKPEDYRYKQWRDQWGAWFYPRSFVQVYLLQGLLMVVVGYPFLHASVFSSTTAIGFLQFVGITLWCVGYFFEVVGDWQLDRFLRQKNVPGTIMQTGLWRYSRHPNYFGEVTMWWGMWLLVAPLPYSYLALLSPVTITFLILKVSGIPMLERRFEGNAQFENYKKRTSAFFPWVPKHTTQ